MRFSNQGMCAPGRNAVNGGGRVSLVVSGLLGGQPWDVWGAGDGEVDDAGRESKGATGEEEEKRQCDLSSLCKGRRAGRETDREEEEEGDGVGETGVRVGTQDSQ